MKNAVDKMFNSDYTYSCHGDIFDITRHDKKNIKVVIII